MTSGAGRRAAAARVVLVGLLVGLSACSGDDGDADQASTGGREAPSSTVPAAPLPGTVKVRLQGIRGAEGDLVAGVLYTADRSMDLGEPVGGFVVKVTDDPFSRVTAIYDGPPFRHVPFRAGPPADVSPGDYHLLMWRAPGPSLHSYSDWLPSAQPGLTNCSVWFEVGDGPVTTVTVAGIPRHAGPIDRTSIRRDLCPGGSATTSLPSGSGGNAATTKP